MHRFTTIEHGGCRYDLVLDDGGRVVVACDDAAGNARWRTPVPLGGLQLLGGSFLVRDGELALSVGAEPFPDGPLSELTFRVTPAGQIVEV